MSGELRETVGRTLMVGLPGPALDRSTAAWLRGLCPAGVILFGRNLVTPEQTIDLLREVREQLTAPSLFAIDQEGGRVSRIEPWVGSLPTAATLAGRGTEAVQRFARATALGLRALGFNLDFAPVVDLCGPDLANGIADRSFGTEPDEATALAGAFLTGLQQAGVAGCLKHFPGLGDTVVDSHLTLPVVERTLERMLAEDLVPFERLGREAASVMVGHGHYTAIDPDAPRPATISGAVVQGVLRDRLGYTGLVVSDDLEMGAVRGLDTDGSLAVAALAAGCDLLLYCADADRAERAAAAIAGETARSKAFRGRVQQAAAGVERTAHRWPLPGSDLDAWEQARSELATASRDPSA